MKTRMYSIRDGQTEMFNKPWYAVTDGDAHRQFASLVNDPKAEAIYEHPQDFDLYFVGTYDDNTGKLTPLDTPQHVIKAVQLKRSEATLQN